MKLGIVGLPNVGKSTLFNAITKAGAQTANYPFCTIESNMGIVQVPDNRLNVLAEMFHPKKVTPASVEFVDIAGLVKGASRGEGLGNQFLAHIREVNAIVHVVRCFDDENVIHVESGVDPKRDMEIVNLELLFADMDTVTRRIEKARKMMKSGEKKYATEIAVGDKLMAHFEGGHPARTLQLEDEEKAIAESWFLLTEKAVIYVANVAENDIGKPISQLPYVHELEQVARDEGTETITLCAYIEEEISTMSDADRQEFQRELGMGESGLTRLIHASYTILGLISFLTTGSDECRAWTVTRGTKAPQAAGKIHTDFERGFIRAEVVPFEQLSVMGSMNACKEAGQVRSEGKDYIIKDGDVVLFRFNV